MRGSRLSVKRRKPSTRTGGVISYISATPPKKGCVGTSFDTCWVPYFRRRAFQKVTATGRKRDSEARNSNRQ